MSGAARRERGGRHGSCADTGDVAAGQGHVAPTGLALPWIVPALILLALTLSLAGCGREEGLGRVRDSGTLRIAMDPSYPPFEAVDAQGALVGLDIDLGREVARRLGVEAHFVTTGYDALYDALTVGRADVIISALYPDPGRTQSFVFSSAYFDAGEVLVVPQGSAIHSSDGLAGRTVACVYGSTGHMTALGWEHLPAPMIITRDDAAQTLAALGDGEAEAVLVDHVSAMIAMRQNPGLQILTPPIVSEPYVVAARVEDGDLLEAVDQALVEMQQDGKLDELIERWMK